MVVRAVLRGMKGVKLTVRELRASGHGQVFMCFAINLGQDEGDWHAALEDPSDRSTVAGGARGELLVSAAQLLARH